MDDLGGVYPLFLETSIYLSPRDPTTHILQKWHFEDDFPFPKVGYANSLEGMGYGMSQGLYFMAPCLTPRRFLISSRRWFVLAGNQLEREPHLQAVFLVFVWKPWDYTPLKFNIAPKNRQSQKETHLPTIIFQGLC